MENKQLRPAISISDIWERIIVSKDTIAFLDNPKYICLLQNKDKNAIAITSCDAKNSMSFKVPEGFLTSHKTFSINSKAFVEELFRSNNLMRNMTYRIYGEPLNGNDGVLTFKLSEAIPREDGAAE